MAQSFAIVGSAAEEAGLNYNELNALVGTLAQNTTLSANELGNAVRGIIAAMQTDKAQQEFAKYGIATKTVGGDFRDLMDILRQLKVMQQGGILDEKAMGALMQAGGAGARRGAQLSAIVQNLPMVMDLITVSENANGEAAQAMGLEMKTLDAATTRLNNAFTTLATTLGGEGGVLGFMTAVTNATTNLVNGIRELVGVMKWAAPVMATFMLARGALSTQQGINLTSKTIPGFMQGLLTSPLFMGVSTTGKSMAGKEPTGILAPLVRLLQGTGVGTKLTGQPYKPSAESGIVLPPSAVGYAQVARGATYGEIGSSIASGLSRQLIGKISIGSLLGPAAIAATNIGREDGGPRAAIGGLTGVVVAALTGSPLWATVGSIIATGFYDKFLTFEGDIAASWTKWRVGNLPPEAGGGGEPQEPLLNQLDKAATTSLNYGERLLVNLSKTWNQIYRGFGAEDPVVKRIEQFMYGKETESLGVLGQNEALLGAYLKQRGGQWAGLDQSTMDLMNDLVNEWIKNQAEKGFTVGTVEMTGFEKDVSTQAKAVADLAATASAEMMSDAIDDIAAGASGAIETYTNSKSAAEKIQSATAYLLATQMRMVQDLFEGYNPPEFTPLTAPQAVGFMAGLDNQQISTLTSVMTELNDQINVYNALINSIPDRDLATDEQNAQIETLENNINNLSAEIPQLMTAFNTANLGEEAANKLKGIVTIPEGLTAEERDKVLSGANKLWREYLEASGLTDEDIDAFLAQQAEQILKIGEGLSDIRIKTPQEYITQSLEGLGLGGGFGGLQDLRSQGITSSMWPQIMASYNKIIATLTRQFGQYGWKPEAQDYGFIFQDGFDTQHVDMTILNMAMQDLIDETKKQGLQGIYNLPEGATFMISATSFDLDQQTRSELGGGIASAVTDEFPESTAPTAPAMDERTAQYRAAMIARNTGEGRYGGLGDITKSTPLPVSVTNWFEQAQQAATPGTFTPVPQAWQDVWKNTGAEPGLSTPVAPQEPQLNFLEKLFQWLSNIQVLPPFNVVPEANTQNGSPTTNLNLDMESVITLTVDGRTLATIIKPFLYQDLIRYMTSANSSVNRSVVG